MNILSEKLKEFGLSDEDLSLVEQSIDARAQELVEAEKESMAIAIDSLVEDMMSKQEIKANELVESVEAKYAEKIEAERALIAESADAVVLEFTKQFDEYSKSLIESVEEKYKTSFEDEVRSIIESYEAKFDEYSQHIVEELQTKHQSQSDLKVAMAEELIESLRGVFGEYNVTLPEATDLESELSDHLEESESQLKALMTENSKLKRNLVEKTKAEIVSKVTEGMTIKQREDFEVLSESLVFTSEDLYEQKLKNIKQRMNLTESESAPVLDPQPIVESSVQKVDLSKYSSIMGLK